MIYRCVGALLAATVAFEPLHAQVDEAARRVIDEAIAAHQPAGRPLKAALRFVGDRPDPTQGLYALGPFERYALERRVTIDEDARRTAVLDRSAIAGFTFERTSINTPDVGVIVNGIDGTFVESRSPLGAIATLLPHLRLRTLRETATAFRLDTSSGETRVQVTLPGGVGTLTFDPRTRLLARYDMPPAPGIYGVQRESLIYRDYRRLNGTAIPDGYTHRLEDPTLGARDATFRLVSAGTEAPAEAFVVPAGVVASNHGWRREPFATTTLAPSVHLIHNVTDSRTQWSFNVLVVEFEDHVVVAEAPMDAEVNERVLAELAKLAPGKPVRHLVLSHHHNDHIGGIEPYVKRGVSLLTTGEASKVLDRIAERRGAEFGTPVVEVVSDRKVLRDALNEAHIYQVGPVPHSSQMLVVHLPRQGILYQVDFVNDGEYPANANTRSLLEWIERRKLRVSTIAGLHGRVVRHPM